MPEYVLIIASSGRMLAQAVRDSNRVPLVIDLFADQDTQEISEKVLQLESLSLLDLQRAVLALQAAFSIQAIIYGSGFENHPESLAWLEAQYNVCGNSMATHAKYSDCKGLFKQLDQLNILYPKVTFFAPPNSESYIIKSNKSSGGQGIRKPTGNLKSGEYYQQLQKGESGSVLFLASKQGVQTVGFHRQWTMSDDDFRFAGIIKQRILPENQEIVVMTWIKELAGCYDFKGLGSLDFIWDGEQCYFLELNLRPPASMMLYPELDLLSAHISAEFVAGKADTSIKGLQVLYAGEDCLIESTQWPDWSYDRPENRTRIKSGQPICSIMAVRKTVEQVEKTLRNHQIFIQNNVIK
ncbi:MAG: ATP-grasp domain-containing protein [Methyloprofundus sp.]|nr:ATP-grasp domain-containing protein [Methyloprofundus sp.]